MKKIIFSAILFIMISICNAQETLTKSSAPAAVSAIATYWYMDEDGDGYGEKGLEFTPIKSTNQPPGYVANNTDLDDTNYYITNIAPKWFYKDVDLDTFGDPNTGRYVSVKPNNYVGTNTDCNDTDATINPNTKWYRDSDGDGYGISTVALTQCLQPAGYVRNAADYDDTTVNITNIAPQTFYQDADGDSYGNASASVYYSLKPTGYVQNGADYNDTTVNITNIAPSTFYRDADGDSFGSPIDTVYYSVKPTGYVTNNTDCNDADATINPNIIWYLDADADGYGTSTTAQNSCIQPVGYVRNASDYNDTTPNITNIAPSTFYRDADNDTFGNPSISIYYSIKPAGYVINNTDCNDADASINPNTLWYSDNDSDGLGDPASSLQQCLAPNNYVMNNGDACPQIRGTAPDCSNIIIPSSDHNYIINKAYKQPTTVVIDTPSIDQVQSNITYFDGLGRPIQQIANKQSSSSKDIITHIGYDSLGRQTEEYLPFKSDQGNMAYDENAKANTTAFYSTDKYDNTSNPFSQKKLESSPLNRVLKQAAPGTSWAMDSGHEIKLDYQTNTGDEVKLYYASASWSAGSGLYEIAFSESGNYAAGELYKNVTYDENSGNNPSESAGSTVEFKNKEGQIVLKRTYEAGNKHDTYYVYDIYGNLTYVIPPKADGLINDEVLNGLCYQYKYDDRNRLAEKKLPGKQWEFIVYDKQDRPVATGPGLSPFKDDANIGWIITKYDVFSRPIYTGWSAQTVSSSARKSLQDAQNSATVLFETKQTSGSIDNIQAYYSNAIAPTNFKLLTVNYYDDYAYPNVPAIPTAVEGQPVLANTKSLATGSWTRAVTTATATAGETAATFYDDKARPIKTSQQNYLGGYTTTDSKLDFTGKGLYTISKHKRTSGSAEITIREDFTYSPQDRLLTHTHQINGGAAELLASNTYDELGQLVSKNVGNSTGNPLQKVDYKYNIRGWLTVINETDNLQHDSDPVDLFAFKINYDKKQTGIANVKELYNGNIAETFWKTGSDNIERSYGYQYDKLNRLTDAIYQKSKLTTESYNENLSYDKNGNILSLNRNGDIDPQIGTNIMDRLVYTYPGNSNQLSMVADNGNNSSGFNDANTTGDDYTYDVNGNLISDKNKNITQIVYNHLNLPKKIIFGTGNTIEYIYNASGQKLEKIVTENNIAVNTNYLGGFQYKDNVLEFFPTAEGYVKNDGGALSYVFQYKDHLGNIRVSFAKNPTTQVLEIIEENNYYPFGLKHKGYNNYVATNNKYKYNGKELQDELGLNFYDYGARNYDPALGRWMNIDPLAEQYRRWTPYNYVMNNPLIFTDPDGMSASPIYDENGQYLGNDNQGFKGEVIFMNRSVFAVLGGYMQDTNGNSNISHETALSYGQTLDEIDLKQGGIDKVNNAITDIVSKADGMNFETSDLLNGKTSAYFATADISTTQGNDYIVKAANNGSPYTFDSPEVPAYTSDNKITYNLSSSLVSGRGQFTVENIQNTAAHEGNGHIVKGIPGEGTAHSKAYEIQMKHSTWKETTPKWKIETRKAYNLVKEGKL